jgi:DNA-binding transcriptional ArsR family regulator
VKKQTIVLFESLANPIRLRIVELCGRKPRTTSELAEAIDVGEAVVTSHIHRLRTNGLLLSERRGRTVYHQVNREALEGGLDDMLKAVRAT